MKNIRITKIAAVVFLSCPYILLAAEEIPPLDTSGTVIPLQITPAPEPTPSLKYRFQPNYTDIIAGNAAMFYERAARESRDANDYLVRDTSFSLDELLSMPPSQLPVKPAKECLELYGLTFHLLRQAARCEKCDWGISLREKEFNFLHQNLGDYIWLAKLIALKTRLYSVEQKYDQALLSLQDGFQLSRCLVRQGTSIPTIAAIHNTSMLTKELEYIIQAPNSPNLYWALTSLPHPFIDVSRNVMIDNDINNLNTVPLYHKLAAQTLTEQEMNDIINTPMSKKQEIDLLLAITVLNFPIIKMEDVMKDYDAAKEFLLKEEPDVEVETMPKLQVIIRYHLHEYNRLMDEASKWYFVPFWQAEEEMVKLENRLDEMNRKIEKKSLHNFFVTCVSGPYTLYYLSAALQRKIDALRCVEAIRIYTASHHALPASLNDIKSVPLPLDPVTGRPFVYRLHKNTAILDCPDPPFAKLKKGFQYHITLTNSRDTK